MSLLALVIGGLLFMQVQTTTDPPVVQTRPPAPGPSAQSTTLTQTQFDNYLVGGADALLQSGANGEFELLDKAWNLPGALLNRNRSNTVDDQHVAQLDDDLLRVLPGLVLAGMAVAAAVNLLGAFSGRAVGPLGGIAGVSVVAIGAFVASNNRFVLGQLVDGVALVLDAIGTAPLRDFASPGLGIAHFSHPLIGAALALLYGLVCLFLLVVLTIELAWVQVLSADAALWVFGLFVPWLNRPAGFLGMRWVGALLSPMVAITALRLAAPTFGDLAGTADPIDQLKRLIFLIVAYQAPGFMAGAISVAFPGFSEAFTASRLIGFGRYTPPVSRGSGGGAGGSTTAGPMRPARPAAGAATNRGPGAPGGNAGPRGRSGPPRPRTA